MTTQQGLKIMDWMFRGWFSLTVIGTIAGASCHIINARSSDTNRNALTEIGVVVAERPADDAIIIKSNGLYEVTYTGTLANAVIAGIKSIPTKSQIRRAMNQYRKAHPRCELCNAPHSLIKAASGRNRRNEVHHYKPQLPFPELAADTNNMVTLCFRHHRTIGHMEYNGGSTLHYNANLRATLRAMRAAFTNNARLKASRP